METDAGGVTDDSEAGWSSASAPCAVLNRAQQKALRGAAMLGDAQTTFSILERADVSPGIKNSKLLLDAIQRAHSKQRFIDVTLVLAMSGRVRITKACLKAASLVNRHLFCTLTCMASRDKRWWTWNGKPTQDMLRCAILCNRLDWIREYTAPTTIYRATTTRGMLLPPQVVAKLAVTIQDLETVLGHRVRGGFDQKRDVFYILLNHMLAHSRLLGEETAAIDLHHLWATSVLEKLIGATGGFITYSSPKQQLDDVLLYIDVVNNYSFVKFTFDNVAMSKVHGVQADLRKYLLKDEPETPRHKVISDALDREEWEAVNEQVLQECSEEEWKTPAMRAAIMENPVVQLYCKLFGGPVSSSQKEQEDWI